MLATILCGCHYTVLTPKGMIAADEIRIMYLSALLMLIVVVPVVVMTFLFAWRYRESNTHADYAPEWAHSTWLEIVWWSIPCVIIAILATITWTSTHRLDPYQSLATREQPAITIQAIALEWKWLFIYPEYGIATVNEVHIPVDVPVQFVITSEGPMNALLVPQLAGQIYAMAGMQTKLSLIANHLGRYDGLSSNFSGRGFAEMKFSVSAVTKTEFKQWISNTKQSPLKLTAATYDQLAIPGTVSAPRYYSFAAPSLFAAVMMKHMSPEQIKANTCNTILAKQPSPLQEKTI